MKWPEYPLSRLTERFISGGTPSTQIGEYWQGNIPWITGADFLDGNVIIGRRYINNSALANSSTNIVPRGSILMVTRTGVGKIAITPVDIAISQDITGIVLKSGISVKYVLASIRNKMAVLLAAQRGATIKGVTRKDIEMLPIPLPPLSEQQKIVEILDQADELRKKRAEADAKAAKIIPALFYKMFGDPATNSKGFPFVKIKKMIEHVERRDPAERPEEIFSYIDIAGVNGELGVISVPKLLRGADAPSRARQIIKTNDVIISTVRPYLRATSLIPSRYDSQICSTGFCVLRAKNGVGFGLLYSLSRLQWFTDQLNARARGASYPAISDSDIFNIQVPILADHVLIKRFDRQILDVLELQAKRCESATRIECLFEMLLHHAFTSHLTAKWRVAHIKELLVEMEDQTRILENKGK